MSIESGRLVVAPTTARKNIAVQPVLVSAIPPNGSGQILNSEGILVDFTVSPDYEGKVYFQKLQRRLIYEYVMFVVVDIEGSLTWVPADLTTKKGVYDSGELDPMSRL